MSEPKMQLLMTGRNRSMSNRFPPFIRSSARLSSTDRRQFIFPPFYALFFSQCSILMLTCHFPAFLYNSFSRLFSYPDIQVYNVLSVEIAESLNKLRDDQGRVLFACHGFVCQEFKYFFSFDPETKSF